MSALVQAKDGKLAGDFDSGALEAEHAKSLSLSCSRWSRYSYNRFVASPAS